MNVGDRVRIIRASGQQGKCGVITRNRVGTEWYVKLDLDLSEQSWRESSLELINQEEHERAIQVLGEGYFA